RLNAAASMPVLNITFPGERSCGMPSVAATTSSMTQGMISTPSRRIGLRTPLVAGEPAAALELALATGASADGTALQTCPPAAQPTAARTLTLLRSHRARGVRPRSRRPPLLG